jgi:hypothetical protein
VTWVMWILVFIRLKTVLVSVQDRCMVCAKSTIGSEIALDAPNGTQAIRSKWNLVLVRMEIALILTQDRCTVCTEHTIGSEINLDAPNRTPRLQGSCGTSFRSVWRQC